MLFQIQLVQQLLLLHWQLIVSFLFLIDAIQLPEFVRGFSNLTTYEGEQVRFEVEVRGDPAPTISWYRDGELIRDSPDFQVKIFNLSVQTTSFICFFSIN